VYLAGTTNSSFFPGSNSDVFLNKYDSTTGNLIWNITWGGTGGDWGNAMATGDSVYLAGTTWSFAAGGNCDAFLNKYDSTHGNLIWNITWGRADLNHGMAIATTGDSIYLAGTIEFIGADVDSNAFLNKYDSDGNLIWNITWAGTGHDMGQAIATEDGDSVYLAGTTGFFGAGEGDAFLNKYDSTDGNLIWNITWGGTGNDAGQATATGDSVYLAGTTNFSIGPGSNSDAFLNKYDSADGNLIWNIAWGGTGNDAGQATATGDSVYLAGTTDFFGAGDGDAFLVKYSEPMPTPTPPAPTPTPLVTPTPPSPTPTPTPSPTPAPPGFEAAFAIAGLLAVAYLVLRRRE
jgi:PGF-CTERM protein